VVVVAVVLAGASASAAPAADPLPSWNDGAAKRAIIAFVDAATASRGAVRVPPEDRIAVFDQDGTLWVEHPLYTQAMFALDRVRLLAPRHPEWKKQQPFAAVMRGDQAAIAKLGEADWEKIIGATHAGMSTEAFADDVRSWLATAKHPRFARPYTELAYQPMLELLAYLRSNGFDPYIVTGGGQEFVRVYSQVVYGIPVSHVVGSSLLTQFQARDGKPVLIREPKPFFIDDHGGKPVGINLFIGKRPLAAFGNSDGDAAMLQWTAAGQGPRFELLVLHDDAAREFGYGPAGGLADTKVGTFSQGLLDQARRNGWTVVSMKKDWKRIFAFEALADAR
jgi:phosphoglycolate phosphatase-like HAD superfamily hydrolase